MKKATFKTLSILLAAVILVAALPVTAFAEDEYCSDSPNGEHTLVAAGRTISWTSESQTSHLAEIIETYVCTWCEIEIDKIIYSESEDHDFGSKVDPEVDMCGTCIFCGAFIEW